MVATAEGDDRGGRGSVEKRKEHCREVARKSQSNHGGVHPWPSTRETGPPKFGRANTVSPPKPRAKKTGAKILHILSHF